VKERLASHFHPADKISRGLDGATPLLLSISGQEISVSDLIQNHTPLFDFLSIFFYPRILSG
jgi:hypothetical protein